MKSPVILRIFKGEQLVEVRQFDLDQIVIGHDADVQLDLNHDSISQIHCLIEKREDNFFICDLGSKTGTFKNGVQILDEALVSGDNIQLGPFRLSFFMGVPKPKSVPPHSKPSSAVTQKKVKEVRETEEVRRSQHDGESNKSTSSRKVVPKSPASKKTILETPSSDFMRPEIKSSRVIHKSKKSKKTFAPPSQISDLRSFLTATKGNAVEVLVAWKERIINSYHFKKNGNIRAQDLNLPGGLVNPYQNLIEIKNGVRVLVASEMTCEICSQSERFSLDQILEKGKGTRGANGSVVRLDQSEVIYLGLGGGQIQIIVRWVPSSPIIPLMPPFLMSNEEVTGLILSLVLVGLLWFTVSATAPPPVEEKTEEVVRVAQVVFTEPVKPPSEPTPPPPPPTAPVPPPTPVKAIVSDKKTETRVKAPKAGKGSGSPVPLRANEVAPIPNSSSRPKKFTSVRNGGAVKIGNTAGANAQSAKDVSKMGLFGAFGGGGIRQKVDEAYSGAGQLLGQAEKATAGTGMGEDRVGEDLGSKFKSVGAGGKGTATQGIAGIGTRGRATGMSAYGTADGFGDKTSVNIEPGGDEANFHGTIDKDAVRRVVLNNLNQIRGCFGRELNKLDLAGRARMEGKVVVTWEIVAKGVPKNVTIKSSTLNNRAVENCIRDRLASWSFPEPPVGMSADVSYPFYLRPGN